MVDDKHLQIELPIKIEANLESKDIRKAIEKIINVIVAPFKVFNQSRTFQSADSYIAHRIQSKDIKKLANDLSVSFEEARRLAMRSESLFMFKAIREQQNIEAIINQGISNISQPVDDEPIDSEWFFEWMDSCKNVTDQEMRSVWARLLSGELSQTGTFSKRTIAITKSLSKEEANLFAKLCSCLLKIKVENKDCYYYYRTNAGENSIERYDLNQDDMLQLEQSGLLLLDRDYKRTFITPLGFEFYRTHFVFDVKPKSEIGMPVGGAIVGGLETEHPNMMLQMAAYPLTLAGNEMVCLCEPTLSDEYFTDLMMTVYYDFPSLSIYAESSPGDCPRLALGLTCEDGCDVKEQGACTYRKEKQEPKQK